MKKELISIIVPAYNIEEYLSPCMDSILSQDYENFEIVLIDDGSTDNTPSICNKYKEKDSRVIVIHQRNAGLSVARNAGIKHARGKYLAFVDGDDLIAPGFLSGLYQAASENSAEVTMCGYAEFSGTPDKFSPKKSTCKTYDSSEIVTRLFIAQENYDIVTWNKLYKKELFNTISFPIGELHEDTLTTYKILAAANKIATLEDKLYYYRKRSGSIMAEQDLLDRLKTKERAAKEAIKYFSNDNNLKSAAEVALLLAKVAYLDNIASGKIRDKNLWQRTIKEINVSRKEYKNNPYLTKKLKLYLNLLKTPFVYKLFRKTIHE